MRRSFLCKAVARSVAECLGQFGGMPHHLLRNTTHVDAGATEAATLDNQGTGAVFRGALGRRKATAAPADCNQVIVFGHNSCAICR